MNEWGAQDLQRRLANLIRVATITDLDDANARARVTCAAVPESAWLPILATRAGPDRSYWLPEPGEQILLLSPSGDPAQGMILPAGYQDAHPPPASDRTKRRTEYADGTTIEYDRKAHVLTVDCVGDVVIKGAKTLTVDFGGDVRVKTPTQATVDTPEAHFTGKIVAVGDVIGEGVSLANHRNTGVKSGGDVSGPPE